MVWRLDQRPPLKGLDNRLMALEQESLAIEFRSIGMTFQAIGKRLGLSRSGAERLVKRAIKKHESCGCTNSRIVQKMLQKRTSA